MKTAAETKTDDNADRILKRRHGMRLVSPGERRKTTDGFQIGIADDVFTHKPKTVHPEIRTAQLESPADLNRVEEPSVKTVCGSLTNLALAAAVGLVVGLLLGDRER